MGISQNMGISKISGVNTVSKRRIYRDMLWGIDMTKIRVKNSVWWV
ncbi:MAG: hypothetical protein ACLUKN_06370 [Bacilli bacterium]